MTLRLIAVHAHPDDESSKGAGSYAKYRDLGVEVMVVSCTGGERGSILNERVLEIPAAHRDLPGHRRGEMAAARDILGIEHRWLGYQDSGFDRDRDTIPALSAFAETPSYPPLSFAAIPVETAAEPLVRLIRSFRPHVMITYDEIGGYPHPDHVRCNRVSVHAWHTAGDPAAYPEAGKPWTMQKLYFEEIFNSQRLRTIIALLERDDPESPLIEPAKQLAPMMDRHQHCGDTRIDVGDYLEIRDRALRAHASQVPDDSLIFFLPNDVQRRAWPYEDYRLAATRLNGGSGEILPQRPADRTNPSETDLFAGVTEDWTPQP